MKVVKGNAMFHCDSCSLQRPPQVVVEIRDRDTLNQCDSCKRILYWEGPRTKDPPRVTGRCNMSSAREEVAGRLAEIQRRIQAACERSGRDPKRSPSSESASDSLRSGCKPPSQQVSAL